MNWGYSIIMLVAVSVGFLLSRRTQRLLPLSSLERMGVGLGAFCGAMIGARLPFVLSDWAGLLSGAAWFSDGKTILTGLAGGYLGVEVAKWSFRIQTKTGDTFAVPVAAAISIGRLGCFQAGCCYGLPTSLPWGVVFPHVDTLPRHPTQLYEAAFHALAAMGLAWLGNRNLAFLRGQLIKLYIMIYAVYRFGTEVLRPEARSIAGLTGYQWSSAVLVLLFAWLWWRDLQAAFANRINRSP